jgi:RNA polymerase sigma-70 factor (ECF subfamily)
LNFDSYGFPFRLSLAKAVEALPPNQREVIRLAYYEGMSQTEMAIEMKQPLGTVKTWARNALVALRQEVAAT